MKNNAIVFGILLMLLYTVYGQTVPAPPSQPETTSIESLINSIKELTNEVQQLRQDLQEVKNQLQDSLNNSSMKNLLFLSAFFISFYAFTRILSRAYNWFAYRGKKREIEEQNNKIVANLNSFTTQLQAMRASFSSLQNEIVLMEKQIAEIRYHTGIDKPQKKSSLIEKLKFWGKK